MVDEPVDEPVEDSLLDGNEPVEDPDTDGVDAVVDDVSEPAGPEVGAVELSVVELSVVELSVVEPSVVDAEVVDDAELSPAGSGSAVPATVVAQPPTSTAARATAAAVHLLRLIDESFSTELGVPTAVVSRGKRAGVHPALFEDADVCDGRQRRMVPPRSSDIRAGTTERAGAPSQGSLPGSCRTALVASARAASSASGG